MDFLLQVLAKEDFPKFIRDMQYAFQMSAEKEYGHSSESVLPEADIHKSLSSTGSVALKAVSEGKIIGGAIVVINGDQGHLDFLYVKHGLQSKGVGQELWFKIEKQFTKVKVWQTCTPYFEKRNLHFYINCLKFSAVEFFNPKHPDPNTEPDDNHSGEEDYFFRFEKKI